MGNETTRLIDAMAQDSRTLVEKFRRLQEIGVALSAEHDIEKLLHMILKEGRALTHADSGSIYIRDDDIRLREEATAKDEITDVTPFIVLKVIQNDSKSFPFKEAKFRFTDKTIAGHVALSGSIVNIADVYSLPAGVSYSYNKDFDEASGYRCKSMLVIPMKNRENEIIGVIQLINKKKSASTILSDPQIVEKETLAFTGIDEDIVMSLASQAGVCIEKTKLYDEIEKLFEGFVTTLTLAVEQRNETTYGHCKRVCGYTLAFAKAINEIHDGALKDIHFTNDQLKELKYAGILHDIGKIAVCEAVLDKRNKLTDAEISTIDYRLAYLREIERQRLCGKELDDRIAALDGYAKLIKKINIPSPMGENEAILLRKIRAERFTDIDGADKPLLTDNEFENLSLQRGNLTKVERQEIERHMTYTWDILKRIPWPKKIKHVPHIASTHHEKLNGSGYPWGLSDKDIPVGGKILAIVDIFEALTAKDRPYKPAIPIEKALMIIEEEVKKGNLDPDLFRIFKDYKIYTMFKTDDGFVRQGQ